MSFIRICLLVALLGGLIAGTADALPYESSVTMNRTISGYETFQQIDFPDMIAPGHHFTEVTLTMNLKNMDFATSNEPFIAKLTGFDPESSSLVLMPPIRFSGGTLSLIVSLTSSATTITALTESGHTVTQLYAGPGNPALLRNLTAPEGDVSVGISFGGDRSSYYFNLGSAALTGNVAPEPATMALMGAGLAGLPVVRRLRNKTNSND